MLSDLEHRYRHRPDCKELVNKICQELEDAGHYEPDPLAPTDKLEYIYYVLQVRRQRARG